MKDLIIQDLKEVDINTNSKEWCRLPYPSHKKGCPNYGKEGCPPNIPDFNDIVNPPFKLVAVKFDLKEHAKKMKEKHPDWSERKARCVLYWQKKLNKKLREESEKIASEIKNSKIVHRPEAYGVNLFTTCRKFGLKLKKNPQETVWKMTIIGITK